MRVVLFADSTVGKSLTSFMVSNYRDDIVAVVTTELNEISSLCLENNIRTYLYSDIDLLTEIDWKDIDLGLSLWWPRIFPDQILSLPRHGFINTHNSFLPNGRGKNPYFWAIYEGTKFGVSLHFLDSSIDTGPIICQRAIDYGWQDNCDTLYQRSLSAMVSLFEDEYPNIRSGNYTTRRQDKIFNYHSKKMFEETTCIDLMAKYRAIDLINILRGRSTRSDLKCAYFEDDGKIYRIYIEITEEKNHD